MYTAYLNCTQCTLFTIATFPTLPLPTRLSTVATLLYPPILSGCPKRQSTRQNVASKNGNKAHIQTMHIYKQCTYTKIKYTNTENIYLLKINSLHGKAN